MGQLDGKTAIVTGGNSGIGLATAKRFAAEGAYVFITGRRQEALDAALAEIGPNATAVRGDVSDLDDIDRLYAAVSEQGRRIDGELTTADNKEGGSDPAARIGNGHADRLAPEVEADERAGRGQGREGVRRDHRSEPGKGACVTCRMRRISREPRSTR